jgi:hypothetical protein
MFTKTEKGWVRKQMIGAKSVREVEAFIGQAAASRSVAMLGKK